MELSHLVTNDIFFALLALFVFVILKRRLSRPFASLPPGPKGLPIVGNVLDMPSEKEWLTFAQWGEQWGEFIKLASKCPG
jgi:hypothetical protein